VSGTRPRLAVETGGELADHPGAGPVTELIANPDALPAAGDYFLEDAELARTLCWLTGRRAVSELTVSRPPASRASISLILVGSASTRRTAANDSTVWSDSDFPPITSFTIPGWAAEGSMVRSCLNRVRKTETGPSPSDPGSRHQ
jgi:hypothetical protein